MAARRYSEGKLRYDLIPQFALEKLAEVYTNGAIKMTLYDEEGNVIEQGDNNWRKGLSWMKTIAPVMRHIKEWVKGHDIDPDPKMQTYHLANAAWGLFTLLEFYKIYPQGDDRPHKYLNMPKIGLDIDEVLADWVGHWCKYHNQPIPENWHFDRFIGEKFEQLKDDRDFWLSIPVKTKPSDIPFEPHCYITSRIIPKAWTEEWLDNNGFPTAPVYCVGLNQSKIEVAKQSGMDIFVDDRFDNFVELNKAGICCYLFDAPHNRRYDVGYKRIKSLSEL